MAVAQDKPETDVIAPPVSKDFDSALGGAVAPDEYPENPGAGTGVARSEDYVTTTSMSTFTSEPDLEADEVSLPRLRLGQAMTPEVQQKIAQEGDWVLIGEDPMPRPVIVPLMMRRDYAHFDRDGYVEAECTDPGCPGRKWRDDPNSSRNIPPTCTRIYRYIVYVTDVGVLAELQFKKSQETVAQYINTFVGTRKMGNFALELGTRTKSGPRGPYQFPTAKLVAITADELEAARAAVTGGA